MSVHNSIIKGDYFKLKYQMLQLGMDVLFVIWSTTIGKIVSGHSLDPRFFFLFLFVFPFIASLFILSFGKFVSAAQRGAPPWTPVIFSPPSFFSLLFFSLLLFCLLLLFAFCRCLKSFVFSTELRGQYMCTIETPRPGISWMRLSN